MRWIFSMMLTAGMVPGFCSFAAAPDRVHIEAKLTQIGYADTAIASCAELRAIAKQDPDSRQYISRRLPALIAIASHGDVQLWISSLQLTADLKAVEAVPLLTELLRNDNKGVATSFGAAATLYDDPVARALSEIGEPSVDSVAKLFKDGDLPTRRRATIVLWNINTENAREAIHRQIEGEPDAELRAFMQKKLDGKD